MTAPLTRDELRLLAAFAENANVRAAARRLGMSRTALSRAVSALEARLGDQLFLRRGRSLAITRFGELLIERAAAAHIALAHADAAADPGAAGGSRLTIATSPLFAELVLPEVLPALLARFPRLSIDLQLSHGRADLFEEVDVALRRGPIGDSTSLIGRRLGRTTMLCVAAAGLVAPAGATSEAFARQLPWIRVGPRLEPWALELRVRGHRRTVVVMPRISADSQRLALSLVERGAGVARLNAFLVRDQLAAGTLVEILPEARSSEDVFAVYPRRREPHGAARDLVAGLLATCRDLALWD